MLLKSWLKEAVSSMLNCCPYCTRMQDFACQISKIFRGLYPRTPVAGGATPSLHPSPVRLRAPAPQSQMPNLHPPVLADIPPITKS